MAAPGTHLSAATKAKISAALKGKPHPHVGHPLSAETKAKLSAAAKARAEAGLAVHKIGKPKLVGVKDPRGFNPPVSHKLSGVTKPKGVHGTHMTNPKHPSTSHALVGVKRVSKQWFRHAQHPPRHATLALVSTSRGNRHSYRGYLHRPRRKKRTRIVVHHSVRRHRVWRRQTHRRRI